MQYGERKIEVLPRIFKCRGLGMVLAVYLFHQFFVPAVCQKPDADSSNILDKILNKVDSLVQNPAGKWSQLPPLISDTSKKVSNNMFNREWNNFLQKLYTDRSKKKKVPEPHSNLIAFNGKTIRSLEIKKVNVFAKNTLDTGYTTSTWLQRAATSIHTGTRYKIIRRNLLLVPGDKFDVFLASENERLIRDMPYIQDARFLVRPVPGEADLVDLILITKDLFPLGFNMEISSPNSGNAGLWYYNILGFGHQFLTSTYWDGDHSPLFGYRLVYGIPSINGSYVSSEIEHTDIWNTQTNRIRIARDFKTVGFKYAGAVEIDNSALTRDLILPDSTISDFSWKYTNYDFWIGRIISLKKNDPVGIRSGLFLSGRLFYNHNHYGPPTSEHHYYAFQDKTQLLFSGSYSHQGFRKDNLIYSFDRIEDVPFGYLINFTTGVEWGQYKTRPYIAAGASIGKYFARSGYMFARLEYGTFMDGNSLEQSTLRFQVKGFTRLHSPGRFKYRGFATFTYLNGINRFGEEFTSLERTGGIPGLTSPSLRGNEKIVLNLETVIFSPYRLLGFGFAFFTDLDLGFIKTENVGFFESRPFSALSLGVRIRNDQLVFNTFELKFSLYPGLPADAVPSNVRAGSVPRLRSTGLFPEKPGVIEYF